MPIKINGSTSGSVTLAAPATGSDVTVTLPSVTGTVAVTTGYQYHSTLYYTSNGTFAKNNYSWLRAIRVRMVGGGGGGAGAATTSSGQNAIGLSGAGAAYAESFITNIASLDSSITVTVGAGGNGGSAGNNGGTTGGNSSFGTLVVAYGGEGGGATGTVSIPDIRGGIDVAYQGTGDLVVTSFPTPGIYMINAAIAQNINGGSSLLGGGARSVATTTGVNGEAARGYGGGGSGGVNVQSQGTARSGGAGKSGIVIVELYA